MDLFQTATSSQQDTQCQPFSVADGSKDAVRRKMTATSGLKYSALLKQCRDPIGLFAKRYGGWGTHQHGARQASAFMTWKPKGSPANRLLFQSCAVNAPHRRDRLWIVGYAGLQRTGRVGRDNWTRGGARRQASRAI